MKKCRSSVRTGRKSSSEFGLKKTNEISNNRKKGNSLQRDKCTF